MSDKGAAVAAALAAPTPTSADKAWSGISAILLNGVTSNGPELVAKLTLLGEGLNDEELDNFNNALTTFEQHLESSNGDWQGAANAAFGAGSVFENKAKSDLLTAAIQAVFAIGSFVQGWIGVLKGIAL